MASLVYCGVRIAQRTDDPFVRLASGAVAGWIGCQAVMNMGAVVGLLPITGITLPLVSFGGSSLLVTLSAIGMLLAFARAEPGAQEALAGRRRQAGAARVPAARSGGPRRRLPRVR